MNLTLLLPLLLVLFSPAQVISTGLAESAHYSPLNSAQCHYEPHLAAAAAPVFPLLHCR
jgi:hypothetical protein